MPRRAFIDYAPPGGGGSKGKVGFSSTELIPVTSAGAIIAIGAGLYGRLNPAGTELLLDAVQAAPAEVFSLFTPGTIAAGTLGVWHNGRASAQATGLQLEANFGTAQTTSDAANYYALEAADSAGDRMILPFTAVAAHFFNSKSNGQTIAQPWAPMGPANEDYANTSGRISSFTPTQSLNVTAIKAYCGIQGPSGNLTGNIRGQILDANLNVLASADQQTAGPAYYTFTFPAPITLDQGTTYYLALDDFEQAAGLGAIGFATNTQTGTPQSAPVNHINAGPYYGSALGNPAGGAASVPTGATWADILLPSGSLSAYANLGIIDLWSATYATDTALLGSGGATVFQGDVTLSIVTVGAPVATAAGSNLNSRILLE